MDVIYGKGKGRDGVNGSADGLQTKICFLHTVEGFPSQFYEDVVIA